MLTAAPLAAGVEGERAVLAAEGDLREVEVLASALRVVPSRISYTWHVSGNGVEEPRSSGSAGIAGQILVAGARGPLAGFGSEPDALSLDGVGRALDKARRPVGADPEFVFLRRSTWQARTPGDGHTEALP